MTRVITAVVGIPLLVYIIQFTPAVVSVLLMLAAMLVSLSEYFSLTGERIPSFFRWFGYLFAVVIFFAFHPDAWDIAIVLLPSGSILILTVALFSRLEPARAFQASVYTLFGVWYVGGLMAYVVGIRMIDSGSELGSDLLLMLFCMIWAGDSFAFFAGKTIGKHKLAPVVSPKKTWEGAVAGFVFSVVAAIICRYTFVSQISLFHAVALGSLVGIIGQIGDLCESVIKRAVQVKDSGGILPGHGGMLDRLDSLLFGAPALYYYFYFVVRS